MQYDQKQFTQAGLNMFSNALSNKESITIDKVIVDDLPTNNFSNLALLSLDSFADAMSFQANYTETSNNTLTVDAVMSNKGFTQSYTINELGLVGHVGNDASNQSLIAVLVASDPFTLPAQQNDETPSQFIPNITIQLANDDMGQVPVMVSNDAYIAQKDLDKLVADNGYIKISDADNRYVKQGDFQNEVNNSVNEKADKSYVDQNISQTNNEVSNKADKSDLNSLQSNINNDVQPQLNSKANQSDLNTTNNNVSSLQSNKADKGDVNGQINQTLSQATAHSDQNLSTANNHSDSNYNDLNDKNNILSQKMEDYQKPNIAPFTENTWYGGWLYPYSFYAEKGKTYYLSAHFPEAKSGGYINSVQVNGGDGNAAMWNGGSTSYASDSSNTDNIYIAKWKADRTDNINFAFGADNVGKVDKICITQSDNYVPFSIAEQNKASIQSENQFTTDYQAPNLVKNIDDDIVTHTTNGNLNTLDTIHLEANKPYWFSVKYDVDWEAIKGKKLSIYFEGLPFSETILPFVPPINKIDTHPKYKYIPDKDMDITIQYTRWDDNEPYMAFKHFTVTQSDSYVPYEIAKRNRLWNNRIVNKTNDLSGRIDDIDKTSYAELKPCDLNNVNQSGTYQSISPIINYKSTPQFSNIDVWYSFTMSVFSTGYDVLQILNISSNNPMFRFKSNDIWQNWYEASSKQDLQNLSNTMNQQFDQANAHTDQVANQLNALDITNQDGKLMHAGKPLLTANAPNAPSLSLSIDSNNNNVQYTITPPSIDGGASITGYTLYYVIEGNSNWQSIPLGTDNLSGEFPATQSVTYQAYAITHNYAGDSPNSITQSILTASAPTINNLTVTNNYPNGLQYNINASSNGATITYTIYYKRTSNNNWQTFNSNNNTGNITEISTDMDNAFQVQVYATNAAGISRGSNTVNQYYFDNTSLDSVISITYNDGGNTITYPISIQASTNVLNLYPNISQIKITHLQTENNSTVTNNINTLFNEPEDTSVTSIMNINSIFNSTNIQSGSTSLTHGDDGYHMYVIIQGMDSSGNNLGINSVHEI